MNITVRIVLVGTTHAGNIGAVARAMKNMGFSNLYLVNPCKYKTYDAYARASGASDVIDNAVVCSSLPVALRGCHKVFATSARTRNMDWEDCSLRDAMRVLHADTQCENIAFVFGRERSGLTNEELTFCHQLIYIPTNPEFSSLNLSAAVQLVVYELSLLSNGSCRQEKVKQDVPAATEDIERFYKHLHTTLVQIKFLDPDNPRLLMRRLRRLYSKSRPTRSEVKILRGILSAAQKCHSKNQEF